MTRKAYRLSADYGCFPMWKRLGDGYANVDPATLLLSPGLQARLARWTACFEMTSDPACPQDSGFATEAISQAFDDEGQLIAEALRAELWPALVEYLLCGRVARGGDPSGQT
jgi:hypothetical protein